MSQAMNEDYKLAEEAAEWLMRLSEDNSPACRQAFFEWFRQSPRHVQEFLDASEVARSLEGLDGERRIDIEPLLAAAATNVVALEPAEKRAADTKVAVRWPRRFAMAAGIAVAAIVVTLVLSKLESDNRMSVATTVGEQRTLKLADGSMLVMNTLSRVDVRFDEHARDIRLLEGEALFTVARDAGRPFRVLTSDAVVQALGTQFDVHSSAGGTTVSVLEGSVQVSSGDARAASPARLEAGQEAHVTNKGRISTRALPEPQKAVAWRERRLEFHDIALAEVVAEFNRYNKLQIRIEGQLDPAKRITGIFSADDPQALVSFLKRDRTLQMERQDSSLVIRQTGIQAVPPAP